MDVSPVVSFFSDTAIPAVAAVGLAVLMVVVMVRVFGYLMTVFVSSGHYDYQYEGDSGHGQAEFDPDQAAEDDARARIAAGMGPNDSWEDSADRHYQLEADRYLAEDQNDYLVMSGQGGSVNCPACAGWGTYETDEGERTCAACDGSGVR